MENGVTVPSEVQARLRAALMEHLTMQPEEASHFSRQGPLAQLAAAVANSPFEPLTQFELKRLTGNAAVLFRETKSVSKPSRYRTYLAAVNAVAQDLSSKQQSTSGIPTPAPAPI